MALLVGIRVALLPLILRLARRVMRGQAIVRKLQPEIAELKKKRLFEETMTLYRKHHYSPFDMRAMVGMFVQLPIFAMLYRAIGATLASGERCYWIRNFASPDGWLTAIVLTLTAGGAYFVPGMTEGTRATMVAIQIGITFFIVWKIAAGYGLYWASSSAIGLLQTLWLRREYAKTMA